MSIHTKVLRVTDEADRTVREHAESAKIGVYDAATLLIMREDGNKGAESSGPTQADFDAMKADRDRLQVEIEEADEARRAAEERGDNESALNMPEVAAYAAERAMSYADALDKLIRLGISRARALDKHAAGKRAA